MGTPAQKSSAGGRGEWVGGIEGHPRRLLFFFPSSESGTGDQKRKGFFFCTLRKRNVKLSIDWGHSNPPSKSQSRCLHMSLDAGTCHDHGATPTGPPGGRYHRSLQSHGRQTTHTYASSSTQALTTALETTNETIKNDPVIDKFKPLAEDTFLRHHTFHSDYEM